MALTTKAKRASVASTGKIWHPTVVFPDGSFVDTDRAHIGWTYAGLEFPAPAPGPDSEGFQLHIGPQTGSKIG